jgi:Uma2 family endonuclease
MPATATIDVVPDRVCEVRSPSTQRHDPEAQGIEVFRRTPDGWLLVLSASGDAVVRAEPFDAIELALATLWAW